MGNAISSHGTIIERAPVATPAVFTPIAELGDLTPIGVSRNTEDASTQNDDIDDYVAGIMRRPEVTFPINFLAAEPTHDHLTGLYHSIINKAKDYFRIVTPDGWTWKFRAFVVNITPQAPMDGLQRAEVTLRPTGPMQVQGVDVGGTFV
jgi:hypothetical protein